MSRVARSKKSEYGLCGDARAFHGGLPVAYIGIGYNPVHPIIHDNTSSAGKIYE